MNKNIPDQNSAFTSEFMAVSMVTGEFHLSTLKPLIKYGEKFIENKQFVEKAVSSREDLTIARIKENWA